MRYVDVNYEPISADVLRSSMGSASPESAYLTVAKRIPIKINVKMDQRKIPVLVTECGNAAMMIEVRQVRINPKASANYGSGGGMGPGGMPGGGLIGAAGGGMTSGGGSLADGEMGSGGSGGSMGGGMPGMGSDFPNDVTVEVSGIMYFYNPPDMTKLGIEQVTEETLVEGDNQNLAGEAVAPTTPPVAPVEDVADEGTVPPVTEEGGEVAPDAPPAADATVPPADPNAEGAEPAGSTPPVEPNVPASDPPVGADTPVEPGGS
jgi:hypothetical protein